MNRRLPLVSKTNLISIKSLFLILSAFLVLAGVGTAIAQVTAAPETPPDSAAGLATFGDRCANCHGPAGEGDGELAVNLPAPPRDFTDPAFLRQAVPADMFTTITDGRIEAGMPPFGPSNNDNPLSDVNRWEAVAAVYSLGTPAESIEQGQAVYEENCMACHGAAGEGEGADTPTFTDLVYWSSTSNQAVFDLLSDDGRLPVHDYTLQDDELWSVVDYIRTFSYLYINPQAAAEPLDEVIISGIVTNGTSGEPAAPGTAVQLRAFTVDLDVALTLTTTVEAEGRYRFDLTDIPPDWFLRTAVFYEDIEFGSNFDQVSLSQPDLELPIIIYEKSTDPAALTINQLHTILRFAGADQVEVNQLYVVSNSGNSIYAGPSGDISEGTFELVLPAEAQLLEFQRGLGSLDNFFPTEDLIPTTAGWADTLPVRPGQGSLVLLARYMMPYNEDGITLSHPLLYSTAEANLVVPEEITLSGPDTWQDTGLQTLENGTFSTYRQQNLPASATLSAAIEGRPRQSAAVGGSLVRNDTAELLIGGGVLLVVVAAAIYAVRQWQAPGFDVKSEKKELLQAIADLDDAYEAGDLSEIEYLEERDDLMADLKAIWTE
jgi:mono/diheme cytochrome c family protein